MTQNAKNGTQITSETPADQLPPAIVFGCSRPGWGIIRAFGKVGIRVIAVYYDNSDLAYVSRYASESFRCPHPENEEENFHAFVESMAERYPGAVMFPSNDYTVVGLASMLGNTTMQAHIAVPDLEVVEHCISKNKTYGLAETLGLHVPKTGSVGGLDEAIRLAEEIGFPCLLKPAVGHLFADALNVKMFKVESVEELRKEWAHVANLDCEMLMQQFISGGDDHGVNYNALWRDGEPQVEITAAKRRLRPHEIGFPTVVTNDYIPEIIEPARALLKALSYDGYANVEFKRDERTGDYYLMEINPRLNLSLLLSVLTDVNYADLLYRQVLDLPIEGRANPSPYSVRSYFIDTDLDLRQGFADLLSGKVGLQELLRPYFSRHISAAFSFSDPMPFFKRVENGVRKVFGFGKATNIASG